MKLSAGVAACMWVVGVGWRWWACSSDEPAVPRASGCALKSDCTPPLDCIFQRCHGVCNATTDCLKGERCIKLPTGNICQLPDEMSCTYTSDCPVPLKCAVDSRCRVACQTPADCLPTQVCTTGVCADHDELLLSTGSLPVTNANGYRGDDAGAEDGPTGSADAGAGADVSVVTSDATVTNEASADVASDSHAASVESSTEA